MVTGILLIARLGSSRLPVKHLIEVNEMTFIDYLLARIYYAFSDKIVNGQVKLIIATSDEPENRQFEDHAVNYSATVFYGNKTNIPERQLECAEYYHLDNIISVDGDDVLCSPAGMLEIWAKLENRYSGVKTIGLPLGMNVMGYSVNLLRTCLLHISNKSILETGWGRIFDFNLFEKIDMRQSENELLRFTLDYQEDASFFQRVINELRETITTSSDSEIIDCVLKNKLYEINAGRNDIYWENFKIQMNNERL